MQELHANEIKTVAMTFCAPKGARQTYAIPRNAVMTMIVEVAQTHVQKSNVTPTNATMESPVTMILTVSVGYVDL